MEVARATNAPGRPTRQTTRQVGRFLLLGVVCLAIDFAVYHFLAGHCGLSITTAKEISYGCAIVVAFWGNKYWTFNSRSGLIRESLLALSVYAVTFVANVWLNGTLFAALLNWLAAEKARHAAFVLATLVTTVLNFVGMKFIAFVPAGDDPPHQSHVEENEPVESEGEQTRLADRDDRQTSA